MKAITPKPLNAKAMKAALFAGLEKFGGDTLKDFESTTQTWKGEKPEMVAVIEQGERGPVLFVGAIDDGGKGFDKYGWVENGTRPHRIYAGIYTGRSTKRVLSFRTGFSPKTFPRIIGSFNGSKFGPLANPAFVNHPGTQPREFSAAIADKRRSLYKKRMGEAMAQAAKVSGHAM